MTTLARLSFWVPPERMDDFAATYRKELVPLLQHHALRESSVEGRPTAAGVFSRLFEMERPADVALKAQALAHDAAWQAALQGIKDRYAPTAARDDVPHRLDVYAAPTGPGQARVLGPGYRQGLWQSFGVVDGLSAEVIAMLQDRHGDLWFGSRDGVSRYDGTQFITFTTEDGLAANRVGALLEDRHDQLWVGTNGGVSRWMARSLRPSPPKTAWPTMWLAACWKTVRGRCGWAPRAAGSVATIRRRWPFSLPVTACRAMASPACWKTVTVSCGSAPQRA